MNKKKNTPSVLLTVLALTWILFAGATGRYAAISQVKTGVIDEEEDKAYKAAKLEPDFDKRALKLFEFIQKYPESKLMGQADFENIKKVEDEYNAYYAGTQEPDPEKRSTMFMDFIQKYPKSTLIQHINYEYAKMLQDSFQSKKYDLLESLAEKWLRVHPGSAEAYGYIAEAARNLQKFEKCAQSLEEIYKIQPSAALSREIHLTYQMTQNTTKQEEWARTVFEMPEFADDYMLRYDLVMKSYKSNNLPKAAEYAQFTLKSIELAKSEAKTQDQIRKVHRASHHVIATNLFATEKYAEAIGSFKEALAAEKYGEGYYRIALCLDNQKQIEEADLYYAMAELMGGEEASKAKARLEALYKALHNDTLIGVDKVYKKAKDLMAAPLN